MSEKLFSLEEDPKYVKTNWKVLSVWVTVCVDDTSMWKCVCVSGKKVIILKMSVKLYIVFVHQSLIIIIAFFIQPSQFNFRQENIIKEFLGEQMLNVIVQFQLDFNASPIACSSDKYIKKIWKEEIILGWKIPMTHI